MSKWTLFVFVVKLGIVTAKTFLGGSPDYVVKSLLVRIPLTDARCISFNVWKWSKVGHRKLKYFLIVVLFTYYSRWRHQGSSPTTPTTKSRPTATPQRRKRFQRASQLRLRRPEQWNSFLIPFIRTSCRWTSRRRTRSRTTFTSCRWSMVSG